MVTPRGDWLFTAPVRLRTVAMCPAGLRRPGMRAFTGIPVMCAAIMRRRVVRLRTGRAIARRVLPPGLRLARNTVPGCAPETTDVLTMAQDVQMPRGMG